MAPETPDPALSHTVGRDTPALLEQTIGDNLEAKLGGISRMTHSDLASLLKGLGR